MSPWTKTTFAQNARGLAVRGSSPLIVNQALGVIALNLPLRSYTGRAYNRISTSTNSHQHQNRSLGPNSVIQRSNFSTFSFQPVSFFTKHLRTPTQPQSSLSALTTTCLRFPSHILSKTPPIRTFAHLSEGSAPCGQPRPQQMSTLAQLLPARPQLMPLQSSPRFHDQTSPLNVQSAQGVEQASRRVARAIRSEIAQGRSQNAFSFLSSYESALSASSPRLRLPTTALIHGLLRCGLTLKAARVAEKAMRGQGTTRWWNKNTSQTSSPVQLSTRTLEAVVAALCARPPVTRPPLSSHMAKIGLWSRNSHPSQSHEEPNHSSRLNKQTRQALLLVQIARSSRQQRTNQMYSQLIDACLLQGEILTASLLFVLLVRDWQMRKVANAALENDARGLPGSHLRVYPRAPREGKALAAVESLGWVSPEKAVKMGLTDSHLPLPYPEPSLMRRIIDALDHTVNGDDPGGTALSVRYANQSSQALGHLASLLQDQALPFSQVASLLTALYRAPSTTHTGSYPGKHVNRHAPTPTNPRRVLDALLESLPTRSPVSSSRHLLPPLDTRSYNSLIHYALRYRRSPETADTILNHMTTIREPPLKPTITTYNIILRASTLFRTNTLSGSVLKEIKMEHFGRNDVSASPPQAPSVTSTDAEGSSATSTRSSDKTVMSRFVVPPAPTSLLQPDSYTLNAFIAHLTASGSPDDVTEFVNRLLFSTGRRGEASRRPYIGPFVYTSIINALRKAGRVGTAERVFLLAKEDERASWAGGEKPWCLPIEVYTSMMQCYGDQARKGLRLLQLGSSKPLPCGEDLAVGWATHDMKTGEQLRTNIVRRKRWVAARQQGLDLYRSLIASSSEISESVMSAEWLLKQAQVDQTPEQLRQGSQQLQGLVAPIPDARFYNALLSLFDRCDGMVRRRRWRVNRGTWEQRCRRVSSRCYDEAGITEERRRRNAILQSIGNDMRNWGVDLPLGIKTLAAGQHHFSSSQSSTATSPAGSPGDTRQSFQPFRIPVEKDRGLPVRTRRRRTRHHSRTIVA